ncbi:MAG: hypothetical protein COB02_07710 [Candidatus Cloacimonadota bacterium]|nr:MAG: hypothetical protein COB02_07710 [Candidatus Cloacimonadota bacterium]
MTQKNDSKNKEDTPEQQNVDFLLSLLEADPDLSPKSKGQDNSPSFNSNDFLRRDISLIISDDKLKVYLSLILQKDQLSLHFDEVLNQLQKHEIVHGINRQLIKKLIDDINNNNISIRNQLICQGTPPEYGKDGKVIFEFNTKLSTGFINRAEDQIDYKELHLINNVEKGQLLATRIPSEQTVDGLDIFGQTIVPPPPKVVSFVTGDNVIISEDENSCYATVDGKVQLDRKIIHVSPIHIISNDVDLKTGNINFNGSVMVVGKVLSGFSIKATKDITVLGTVEAAQLISGRNIIIKSGFIGQNKGKIQCKGDLTVKFIEGGNIECHGKLLLESSIVNSTIIAYQSIRFSASGKGQILGGNVTAVDGIICKEIGSKLGVSTNIIIGDKFIIRERISETTAAISTFETKLKKIKILQHQDKEQFTSALKMLNDKQRLEIVNLITNKENFETKLNLLNNKKSKLQILYNRPTLSKLLVKGVAHSGTEITIGNNKKKLQESFAQASFSEDPYSKRVSMKSI